MGKLFVTLFAFTPAPNNIQKDNTLNQTLVKEVIECLEEISQNIKNGNKPKFAIKSLIDLAGNISSISSWIWILGQYAGIIPPTI